MLGVEVRRLDFVQGCFLREARENRWSVCWSFEIVDAFLERGRRKL